MSRSGSASRFGLDVEVYGRQDIRDDSLGDRPEISFDWTAESYSTQTESGVGDFRESVAGNDDRARNGEADDRRALYIAPSSAGRFLVKAELDPGDECLGKRPGETDEEVIARCSAEFEVMVMRPSAPQPTPVPPRDPSGPIPPLIVDGDGTNYEVFTPEGGGVFLTEKCSLKIPEGAGQQRRSDRSVDHGTGRR